MAQPKTDLFELPDKQIADIAKALSHPARVKILRILNASNCCMVGNLVNILPLSQSTVSQHLKELKRAGLIKGKIEGPRVNYCLDEMLVAQAKTAFSSLFSEFKCC